MNIYLVLFLGILTNAGASILIKYATQLVDLTVSKSVLTGAIVSVPFWLGVFSYGLSLLFYTLALSKLSLNLAHPIMTAGALITVATFATILFGESTSVYTIFGVLIVIVGLIVLSLGINS
jgi:small multidrug resistance pump